MLVVAGWADKNADESVRDAADLLFRHVVIPACVEANAVIVTGGTNAGVMALVGDAVADATATTGHGPLLVGVAPSHLIVSAGSASGDSAEAEPRHRLITTPGKEWGDEAPFLVRIAEHIAKDRGVTVLAVGGGKGARSEIELAAERSWPTILTTGYDGASTEVAQLLAQVGATDGSALPPGSSLARAQRGGTIITASLPDRDIIRRLLAWRLTNEEVLKYAWTRFDAADHVSTTRKKPTITLALAVLTLAFLTVLCGLFAVSPWVTGRSVLPSLPANTALKIAATALPLTAAILLGVIDRRATRGTWIELRAASESLLREIYRYRAEVDVYAKGLASDRLANQLTQIDARSSGRSFHQENRVGGDVWPPSSLTRRIPSEDCLVDQLKSSVYDRARVRSQINHFEESAMRSEKRTNWLSLAIFILAAVSAFLLSLSWEWSNLTGFGAAAASAVAAVGSWREYSRGDDRAKTMLLTAVALRSARAQWLASTARTRDDDKTLLRRYAKTVEAALADEGTDWRRSLGEAQTTFLSRQRAR